MTWVYFIMMNALIIWHSTIREMISTARKKKSYPVGREEKQRQKAVLGAATKHRIVIILSIYLLTTMNTLLFDAMVPFPFGILISGVLALVLEKGPKIFSKGIRLFVTDIEDAVTCIHLLDELRLAIVGMYLISFWIVLKWVFTVASIFVE